MGADAYGVAEGDGAADHGERVQVQSVPVVTSPVMQAWAAMYESSPEAEVVGVDRRRLGHVTPFADLAVAARGLLPLAVRGALLLRRLLLEQSGAVVEVPYGCRVIHTAHAGQSARDEGRGPYGAGRVTPSGADG
ncbi:hypothetical protein ACFZC6_03995 [Streptomyces ossamyceticus]|uniref:hypothetical protein n=1 Tax=Streptomyces ossamyceticus TaxID=249581 RepID=UPI0036E4416F